MVESDAQVAARNRTSAADRERERNEQAAPSRPRSTPGRRQSTPRAGTGRDRGTRRARPARGIDASGGLLSAADRASFGRLSPSCPARRASPSAASAVADRCRAQRLPAGVAWSTAKALWRWRRSRPRVGVRHDLVQAITASDNAAAERLWSALGEGRRGAGTTPHSCGPAAISGRGPAAARRLARLRQTTWSLTDQARFAGRHDCTDAGKQVHDLVDPVVAGRRWGLDSAGDPAGFKGRCGRESARAGATDGLTRGWAC